MAQFSLIPIEAVQGKQRFYKLIKNDICVFDQFCNEIENTNYNSELLTIFAYMDKVANLQTLPHTKFKDITPSKSKIKEYEFKSKHLRVYLFHETNTGKIVVCGGYKNNQSSDIEHFRNLKKEYFASKE